MLEILSSFIEMLSTIVQFITNSIYQLFVLFSKIPTYVTFIGSSVAVLPDFIIPFALCAIALYVVLFILGR